MGDPNALPQLLDFATHKDHLFRAACAWALGFLADPLGKPILQDLSRDSSMVVRKRALKGLLTLESVKTVEVPEIPTAIVEPDKVEVAAEPVHSSETVTPNFFVLR